MSLTVFLALPLLVLAAIGAKALVGGLRVRRRGDAPHCRRCDYRLTGIATGAGERCPECGTALDERNVARGERYRAPGLALRGGVLLLATLVPLAGLGWREARGYDWYRLRPAGWLVHDVATTNSSRAMRELMRRQQAGSLSESSRDQLIAVALAAQPKGQTIPIGDELVGFLDAAATLDQLTDAQRQQFFDQSVQLSLTVMPSVNVGEQVVVTVVEACRTSGGRRYVAIDEMEVEAEGTKRPMGGSTKMSGLGAGGSTGSSVKAKAPPGKRTIVVRARVRVFRGGGLDAPNATPDHERKVTLTADYEVTDPSIRPAP